MSPEKLVAFGFVVFVILAAVAVVFKKTPRKPKKRHFVNKWRELQKLCSNKDTWPLAVINADNLLDEVMKNLRISGKTMGERLVSAQKIFTDIDGVWYAHKLRNKLAHGEDFKLSEKNVKDALVGFLQALKDLGAL